jgi:hypothetical protein
MLMKLTPGVNFNNILLADLQSRTVNKEKLQKALLLKNAQVRC